MDVDGAAWVCGVVEVSEGRGCMNFVEEGLEFLVEDHVAPVLAYASPDVDGAAWVHGVVKGSKGRGCMNFVEEGLEFLVEDHVAPVLEYVLLWGSSVGALFSEFNQAVGPFLQSTIKVDMSEICE